MAETTESRIHPATPRKRQQARDRGQVAKSADLTAAVLFGGAIFSLLIFGNGFADHLKEFAHHHLSEAVLTDTGPDWWHAIWSEALTLLGFLLLPALIFLLLLPLGTHFLQTRFLLHLNGTTPDWSRIGPQHGTRRIFSTANVFRAGFGIAKLLVVGAILIWAFATRWTEIIALCSMPVENLAPSLIGILLSVLIQITVALLLLSVLDFLYQRRRFEAELMMTTQEIREEIRTQQPQRKRPPTGQINPAPLIDARQAH